MAEYVEIIDRVMSRDSENNRMMVIPPGNYDVVPDQALRDTGIILIKVIEDTLAVKERDPRVIVHTKSEDEETPSNPAFNYAQKMSQLLFLYGLSPEQVSVITSLADEWVRNNRPTAE